MLLEILSLGGWGRGGQREGERDAHYHLKSK